MQCESFFASNVMDPDGERCQHPAIAECGYCGNQICLHCQAKCWECGESFCNPYPGSSVTCLDDHEKESGHSVEMPKKYAPPVIAGLVEKMVGYLEGRQ